MIKNTRELLDYSCICRIIMYISKSNPMAFEIEGVKHQTEKRGNEMKGNDHRLKRCEQNF